MILCDILLLFLSVTHFYFHLTIGTFLADYGEEYSKMAFESEYKLDSVAASRIVSEQIDATFKSSTIGK